MGAGAGVGVVVSGADIGAVAGAVVLSGVVVCAAATPAISDAAIRNVAFTGSSPCFTGAGGPFPPVAGRRGTYGTDARKFRARDDQRWRCVLCAAPRWTHLSVTVREQTG